VEGVGIKEKYKRMLMKQKTNDRNFLFLDNEEFNSDYILETDYRFMERGDTLVTSKKMGRSTALNKHDEEYEEYGEEEEEAV